MLNEKSFFASFCSQKEGFFLDPITAR